MNNEDYFDTGFASVTIKATVNDQLVESTAVVKTKITSRNELSRIAICDFKLCMEKNGYKVGSEYIVGVSPFDGEIKELYTEVSGFYEHLKQKGELPIVLGSCNPDGSNRQLKTMDQRYEDDTTIN